VKANFLAGALIWLTAPAFAQPPVPVDAPRPSAPGAAQARFQIRIMEGVLESAVQHGAQTVGTQMRTVSPEVALFSGPARARGFRLEGYGVFFCVDVPALHRSISWSVRTLTQSNADLTRALQAIRRIVQAQNDPRMKTEAEQALRLVELQVGPRLPRAVAVTEAATAMERSSGVDPLDRSSTIAASAVPEPADAPPPVIANPSAAYTTAVQTAIVDAMLDYGSTLKLADEEWLTVAARENSDSMLDGDLTETVTITLRVRATDLEAFKAGRLTRDDVRSRVEVRGF
jgi:hypothetical protein